VVIINPKTFFATHSSWSVISWLMRLPFLSSLASLPYIRHATCSASPATYGDLAAHLCQLTLPHPLFQQLLDQHHSYLRPDCHRDPRTLQYVPTYYKFQLVMLAMCFPHRISPSRFLLFWCNSKPLPAPLASFSRPPGFEMPYHAAEQTHVRNCLLFSHFLPSVCLYFSLRTLVSNCDSRSTFVSSSTSISSSPLHSLSRTLAQLISLMHWLVPLRQH